MNYFKKSLLTLFTLLLLLTLPTSLAFADTKSYESLKSTNPTESFDDLTFLKDELKGKNIVAIGESTHGTGSFFQFKDRIFRFLVNEMGFKGFAIEVQMSLCEEINKYVQTGEGDISALIKNNGSVFATNELLDLVKWMREYNKTVNDSEKLRFYGFDVQDVGDNHSLFKAYYEKVNSSFFKEETTTYSRGYTLFSKVVANLQANKDAYIKASSPEEFDFIEKLAINIKLSDSMDISNRDLEMKNNVLWLQNYEKKYYNNDKIMLWGHNYHISKEEDTAYSMGNLLSKSLGNSYYSLGLDLYSGNFNTAEIGSRKPVGLTISESSEDVFSGKIHSLFPNEEILYFNVAKALEDPKLKDAFTVNVPMYAFGWTATEYLTTNPCNIKTAYDGVVYFKNTFESTYIDPNRQPTNYTPLINIDAIDIATENSLTSKILILALTLLGLYILFYMWKNIFKDNHLEKETLKGKKILALLISLIIISRVTESATSLIHGESSSLGILIAIFTLFISLNLFKGKNWAKILILIIYILSLFSSAYTILLLLSYGSFEYIYLLLLPVSISILTIVVLNLKPVKSYYNHLNHKE